MKLKLFGYNAQISASMSTTSSHQIVKDQPGGGLRLVHKDLSTKLLEEGAKTSFQYAKWSTTCKILKIIAIYHPPYSTRNLVTDNISWTSWQTGWWTPWLWINMSLSWVTLIYTSTRTIMKLQTSFSPPWWQWDYSAVIPSLHSKKEIAWTLFLLNPSGILWSQPADQLPTSPIIKIVAGISASQKDDVTRKEIMYRKLKLIN